jgi:hypothetical protein
LRFVQFLKALDVLEANRIDDGSGNSAGVSAPLVAPLSAGIVSAHNTLPRTPAPAASAAPTGATSVTATVAVAGGNSPRSVIAAETVSPARQLLDQAAGRVTSEDVLFDGTLLTECDDYFLAAAVLLEEVSAPYCLHCDDRGNL